MSSKRRKLRMILEGPTGIGKTTLMAALRNVVKAHGGTLEYEPFVSGAPTTYQRKVLAEVNPPDDVLGDYDIIVVERDAVV